MSRLLKYYGDFDVPMPEYPGGEKAELSCDIVIIGAGGSGLAAAVRAGQLGKKVILLEKMEALGGNARLAGGLLCTNSKRLLEEGYPDLTDAHIDEYRRQHQYILDESIFTRFIRNTGTVFDWLVELGLDTDNYRVVMDKVVMIKERTEWEPLRNPAYGPGIFGTAVTSTLIKNIEKYDITLLQPVRAQEFLMDGKKVAGVKAIGCGKDYTIKAENVILCSGGFGCDNQLLQRFFPKYCNSDNLFTHYCLSHSTGDGLKMSEKIGARVGEKMSIGLEAMVHMPGEYSVQKVCGRPEGIIVSDDGKRFMPEDDMENGEFILDLQKNGEAWYLMNEKNMDEIYRIACENVRYGDWVPEVSVLHEDLKLEIPKGTVLYAETIDELAPQIGADAKVLIDTIADYSTYCRLKKDLQFNKSEEYLMDLGMEGPWYAIRITRKFDVTMGGVSVDSAMRAVYDDGSTIPGLYVCGDIASGWMGEDYGPLFSSFAWAINSGYLAAGEICGVYKKDEIA